MDTDAIQALLADSGATVKSCVVVSRSEQPASFASGGAGDVDLLWLDDVNGSSDLGDLDRRSLAIVFDQLEYMGRQDATHLLAQLRDRYAERVVVFDNQGIFTAAELLALGFTRHIHPAMSGRVYIHDPDRFFERREWNNSRDWANPENFEKYRW